MFKDFIFSNLQRNNLNLKETNIVKYGLETNVFNNNDFFGNQIIKKIQGAKDTKLLIKATDYDPTMKYYGIIAESEKGYIKTAIEYLLNLFKKLEIIVLVDKENEKIFSSMDSNIKVLKIKDKQVLSKDKLVKKIYGSHKDNQDVIFESLISLVYLGREIEKCSPSIILSVFGDAIDANRIVEIPMNTKVIDLFKMLNGRVDSLKSVIVGGSYTGIAIYNLEEMVDPYVGSIIFNSEIRNEKEIQCIRCSDCLRKCPKGLNPIKLTEARRKNEKNEFIALEGYKCVDCGICSSICPSNIELAYKIKVAKEFFNK